MSVVDASVLISALTKTELHHATSRAWLESRFQAEDSLIAPAIILSEVAGPIARRTGETALGEKAVQLILNLPNLRLVNIDAHLGKKSAHIAATYKLRGADAIYVSVAEALDQPLITWDKQQRERASDFIRVAQPNLPKKSE